MTPLHWLDGAMSLWRDYWPALVAGFLCGAVLAWLVKPAPRVSLPNLWVQDVSGRRYPKSDN